MWSVGTWKSKDGTVLAGQFVCCLLFHSFSLFINIPDCPFNEEGIFQWQCNC